MAQDDDDHSHRKKISRRQFGLKSLFAVTTAAGVGALALRSGKNKLAEHDVVPFNSGAVAKYGVEYVESDLEWNGLIARNGLSLRIFSKYQRAQHITSIDISPDTIDIHYDDAETQRFNMPVKSGHNSMLFIRIIGDGLKDVSINLLPRESGRENPPGQIDKTISTQLEVLLESDLPRTTVNVGDAPARTELYVDSCSSSSEVRVMNYDKERVKMVGMGNGIGVFWKDGTEEWFGASPPQTKPGKGRQ